MKPSLRLATLLAGAFTAQAFAADPSTPDEPLLIVTATRFNDADPRVPANISVITRSDIRNSPARDLPGLLATRAGIQVRPLYGSLGLDTPIDLRGFGESGVSNTVVLLDGQRLNAIDSSPISWSTLPLEAIERIEIMRGAGTVLYGDRATGGVINIVTDKSAASHASLTATAGSFDTRGLDASLTGSVGDVYGKIFAHHAATEGWRQNAQAEQNALSGRVGSRLAMGEIFADYAAYADRNGLPGYQRSDAYLARSTASRTPRDSQERDGYRLRPGVALPLGDNLRIEAETTVEHERLHANYAAFGSTGDRDRDSWSLTPRLIWKHGLGGLPSETVAGIDHYDGKIDARYSDSANQGAKQVSTAWYLQNQTSLGAWTGTLGARQQSVRQSVRQDAYAPYASPAMQGSQRRSRSAWDAGLTYAGEGWRVYGKLGSTFRFANTDELFSYDPINGNPVFAGDLRPQHGSLQELGGDIRAGAVSARLSLFRMRLHDEIGFDGNSFANVNFASTRRQGIEAELDWRIAEAWKARFAYTHLDATFTAGPYAGRQLPLVARDTGSLQLSWDGGRWGRYTALLNSVGERAYSGDFRHERKALAGYSTLDLHAAWNVRPWTISLRVANALDKRYAAYAGYSGFINDYYYYPADRRGAFLSARIDLR